MSSGRKKTIEKDPTLKRDLEALIEPATCGGPESPERDRGLGSRSGENPPTKK